MVLARGRTNDEKHYQQSQPPDDAADAYETDIMLSTKRYNDLPETERGLSIFMACQRNISAFHVTHLYAKLHNPKD
jgi:hypothetical protein